MKTLEKLVGQSLHMSPVAGLHALHAVLLQSGQPIGQCKEEVRIPRRPLVDAQGDDIPQRYLVGDIAVIPVFGKIIKGASGFEKWAFGFTSYEDIHEDLDWALASGVRAIILWVNSPGGSHIGCQELAERIAGLARVMPVFDYTDHQQASAAEFITAGCTMRLSTKSAVRGSIGSILSLQNVVKMYETMGVSWEHFVSGKYKGMGQPTQELTDEQRQFIQSFVDYNGAQFRSFMMAHRPRLKSEDLEGQFFTGAQAYEKGFVDATVSNLQEALALI